MENQSPNQPAEPGCAVGDEGRIRWADVRELAVMAFVTALALVLQVTLPTQTTRQLTGLVATAVMVYTFLVMLRVMLRRPPVPAVQIYEHDDGGKSEE